MTGKKPLGAGGQARNGAAEIEASLRSGRAARSKERLRRANIDYLAAIRLERERLLADPGWQARKFLEQLIRSAAFDSRVVASPERAGLQTFLLAVVEAINRAPRGAAAHDFGTLLHRWWASETAARDALARKKDRTAKQRVAYASAAMAEREAKVKAAWEKLPQVHRGHGAVARLMRSTGFTRETVRRCAEALRLPLKKRVG